MGLLSWSKKRGTIWDGIRDAYNIHEAFELLEGFRRSGGRLTDFLAEPEPTRKPAPTIVRIGGNECA